MLSGNFQFHPIGQGCFYTGEISLERRGSTDFKFVYDCGSNSKTEYLRKEIDVHKKNILKGTLDLLILSHFDADHVNGVSRLLENIKCRRLVMPYYDPVERLLLLATTDFPDENYRAMLEDPIGFFGGERFDIDEIIVIGGPGEGFAEGQNINPDKVPSKTRSQKELSSIKKIDFSDDCLSGTEEKRMKELINKEEDAKLNLKKVKFLQQPYAISVNVWEFFFYLKKCENVVLNNFALDVKTMMDAASMTMREMFRDDNLTEIKKIYRKYYGLNLNVTSLVTYHGPLFPLNAKYHRWHWLPFHWLGNERYGTLLTGDADLGGPLKNKRVTDHFRNYLDQVCVFQVPHHGSKRCWYFKASGLESFCTYVINHGLGRKHHPSSEVVHYIKKKCSPGRLCLNNEVNEFAYGFSYLKEI